MNARTRTALAACGVVLLLATACLACEDAPPPRKPAVSAPSPAVAAAVGPDGGATETAAGAPTPYEYMYSPVGKRDPFRNPLLDLETGQAAAATACQSPLCRWDLDQFRLVGIVSGMSTPVAMVEDPKGKGHIIRRGSAIGKNNGKVSTIRPNEVVVTEIVRTTGKPVSNPIVIKMPRGKTLADEEEPNLLSEGAEGQ